MNSLALVKRMFFLAWQASQVVGMGMLQDRGPQTEDQVWENIQGAADYPANMRSLKDGQFYGDYVFGRMMKMGLEIRGVKISWRDSPLRIDYESWCVTYPTYDTLRDAAKESLRGEVTT